MGDGSARIFSLEEANEVVPRVAECTAEIVHQLDEIRQRYKTPSDEPGQGVPEWVLKEVEEALVDWSKRISELGAVPKGYFTVDFQSVPPPARSTRPATIPNSPTAEALISLTKGSYNSGTPENPKSPPRVSWDASSATRR